MDIYGMSSSGHDFSGVDELLDFSNDHGDATYTYTSSTDNDVNNRYFQYSDNNNNDVTNNFHNHSTDFTDGLCLPNNDVAELEWLSNFVHDSFSNFPANNVVGTINYRPENASFHSRSRSKRTRAPTNNTSWTSTPVKAEPHSSPPPTPTASSSEADLVRRCTHCASEKTPQWRTGPLGPKTLCNACGVRFKSGRLVPEYRPAASPTFVLTQHSNSHRKVMELRRQKEVMHGQQQQLSASQTTAEYQMYGGGHHRHRHHNRNNYEVC